MTENCICEKNWEMRHDRKMHVPEQQKQRSWWKKRICENGRDKDHDKPMFTPLQPWFALGFPYWNNYLLYMSSLCNHKPNIACSNTYVLRPKNRSTLAPKTGWPRSVPLQLVGTAWAAAALPQWSCGFRKLEQQLWVFKCFRLNLADQIWVHKTGPKMGPRLHPYINS